MISPSPPGFPTRLRKLRLQHGYTQAGLAEIVEVHPRTIGFWEVGKHRPAPGDALIKTAAVLGVTVRYLLEGKR